jgi:Cysteine-rich secretory protein family
VVDNYLFVQYTFNFTDILTEDRIQTNKRYLIVICRRTIMQHLLLLFCLYINAAAQEIVTLSPRPPSTPTLEQRAETETTVIVTVTVAPSVITASPSYTNSTEFEQDVLNTTNYYRHQYNASDLVWNDTLATYGQQWAEPCNWKHSVYTISF